MKKDSFVLVLALVLFLFLEIGVSSQFSDNVFPASLFVSKKLEVKSPNGAEEWKVGEENSIAWFSKGISKVGIVLFKGSEPQWIAKNIDAGAAFYKWNMFSLLDPSQDYKIAVFEYPWQKGNKIDYSDKPFTIIGPRFSSCDTLSIPDEFPYLPSNYPNIRKVFITDKTYDGNMEGLVGADQRCQQTAESNNYIGTWKALLGDDKTLAIDRMTLSGLFVEAIPAAELPSGESCHRLLGEDFNKFFEKLSNPLVINREKLSEDFLKYFSNVWLGRINDKSPKNCTYISSDVASSKVQENYSYTTTCENWTKSSNWVLGYPKFGPYDPEYPSCYTSASKQTYAVGEAGLATGLTGSGTSMSNLFSAYLGKECNSSRRLICVQQ
jgi:hypothetical protein